MAECLWPSTSCLCLSVELCESPGSNGFSSDRSELGAGGLCIPSAGLFWCPVGLAMDRFSWSIKTVFLCDEASSEMVLGATLFSDVESVNIQNNEGKVSIKIIDWSKRSLIKKNTRTRF